MLNRALRNGTRGALLAAIALAALSLDVRPALAQSGPPMVWRHDISRRVERDRIRKYGVGPYADGQTRLETELRADISLKRLDEAKAMMNELAADQKAAEKVFGKGHRVVALSVKPRNVWDLYIDTRDGRLAEAGASLRIRIENGIAQINYKPPGGKYFVEGGKIGLEAGITVKVDPKTGKLPAKLLDFLKNTRLVDNPLREFRKHFPDLQVEDIAFLQLENKQIRQIYEVQQLEHGQWVKKSEISVDRVTGRDPANPRRRVVYGKVELEGDHVSAGALNANQQAALQSSNWRGPHKAKDALDPRFAESADVMQIRGYMSALVNYLKVKPVKENKYAHSRRLLKQKGVKFGRRYMFTGIKPPKARPAARNSKSTRARATAARASRTRARGARAR